MTEVSFDDVNRLILAAAGVPNGGSLGPASKEISPGQFPRGYISAGHQADSPANRRRAASGRARRRRPVRVAVHDTRR